MSDAELLARMQGLLTEHGPALRRYQELSPEEAQALKARVDASAVAWRRVDGDVGPVPPLHFELTRTATRGGFVPEGDDATGDWMVGVDATGRVVREGPERVYLYGDLSIDHLVVQTASASRRNSRNTSVLGASRLVLNDSGNVVAGVSFSTGGRVLNAYSYEWSDGLVSRKVWWSSQHDVLRIYRVERGSDGVVDRIVLEPELVVYARRKVATGRLVRRVEAEVVHLVDLALLSAAELDEPVYAVVLTYSGSSAASLFPPSIWIGPNGLRAAVEAGEVDAEEMWNPLIDSMKEVNLTTRTPVLEAAAQIASGSDEEVLPKAYRRLAKKLTRALRARRETVDDFVVVAFDPEYESVEDALGYVLSKRELDQFRKRGLLHGR